MPRGRDKSDRTTVIEKEILSYCAAKSISLKDFLDKRGAVDIKQRLAPTLDEYSESDLNNSLRPSAQAEIIPGYQTRRFHCQRRHPLLSARIEQIQWCNEGCV
mmetsp:Transcript_35391/g.63775  ORF Transcript_35391/g.63775 Transcript_35391/m.63775 type:complete len:103 (+) Transcript_35391:93-401(+)